MRQAKSYVNNTFGYSRSHGKFCLDYPHLYFACLSKFSFVLFLKFYFCFVTQILFCKLPSNDSQACVLPLIFPLVDLFFTSLSRQEQAWQSHAMTSTSISSSYQVTGIRLYSSLIKCLFVYMTDKFNGVYRAPEKFLEGFNNKTL